MKRFYSKYIALVCLVILTLAYSCKKLLNQQPVGSLSQAVLASKAGVDGLLIGAYSMLDGYTNQGGAYAPWEASVSNWTYGGIASDDAYKGSNTTDQPAAAPLENHSVDPSNEYIEAKWEIVYNSVQRANDAIREVPLVKDGSISASYGAEVIAEARFLRGVYHMEAAKMWGVYAIYVDESVTYGAGNYNIPNGASIWPQIEADFKAAMAVLPKTQPQIGRANYYAAEAFLAKAYMFDHQYSTALPLLTDLINNGETSGGAKYALGPYENNFNASTKNGPESVFAVQMTVNDGSGGNNGNGGDVLNYPAGTYTSCCGFYQPSYSLANSFKTDEGGLPIFGNDANGIPNYSTVNLKNDHGLASTDPFTPATDNLDPRLDWTVGRRGIPYLDWGLCGGEAWSRGDVVPYNPIKNLFYHAASGSTADTFGGWAANQDNANNFNIIRLADVYLWRAECYVDAGSLALAEADVNVVRGRMVDHPEYWVHTFVDNTDPSKGFTNTPAANYVISRYNGQFAANGKAYAQAAVWMERKLELGMEGSRFFDLQRYDSGPAGAGYMAGVLNAYIKADTRISNPVLNGHTFTQGKNEFWPVPLKQVDLEAGKLKQNPKY
jgi:hypothetical protein